MAKTRQQLEQDFAALEKRGGFAPGSKKPTGFTTRAELQTAFDNLKAEVERAAKKPTAANRRRLETASRETAKQLSAVRRAEASRPSTPTLDQFNEMSGARETVFYRENKAAIHAEQWDLAAWEAKQRRAAFLPKAAPPTPPADHANKGLSL